VSEKVKEVMW